MCGTCNEKRADGADPEVLIAGETTYGAAQPIRATIQPGFREGIGTTAKCPVRRSRRDPK